MGHLPITLGQKSEAQISAPFAHTPWRAMNPTLKTQPGLLHKTWLSGTHTNSVGGFYAFETLENATRFATVEASLPLNSPFFRK